jgi:RNA polymerase sigma factor (sigma-70 family)
MKAQADQSDHLRTAATVVATLLSSDEVDDTVAEVSPFDSIYDTYAPLLRRIAVGRFGISTVDAADLVHDVFATYLVNPRRVEELRPYLIGAICNASRSYLRKSNTRNAGCSGLAACDIADDTSMHERVVREVLIGRILGRLGRSCRDALLLFYLHGETAAVIAERRNTTPGYIGRLLHFCRKRALAAYQAMETEKR